ncbi:MAG TPA: helix-turn-helix transcriptional regulator [Flavobacteriaceae bacterium]|nr:helix-turn-helix transcriptional regulator [Flavobacteriaceae bacterium]
MNFKDILKTYSEIFKSYGSLSLEKHIKKIIELDAYLPYSSTFFCITNTQKLSFEYISKNMHACLGIDQKELKEKGMQFFWSKTHPDDLQLWLEALTALMNFTMKEIPFKERHKMSYTWNYRLKHAKDNYVNIIQNTTPLEFDTEGKPVIGLAHYTVLNANMNLNICASAKMLNENNEYETKYFNNFSQKLLPDGLTIRERDIIRLLILGKSSRQIANNLNISFNTVNTHRRNILKKLKIKTTGELVGMIKMNKNWI